MYSQEKSLDAIEEAPIIGQYDNLCRSLLETMNGKNFLSQGSADRIELMLFGIDLKNKEIVGLGCGIGGSAIYIAQKYKVNICGVDVDPQLIEIGNKISKNTI